MTKERDLLIQNSIRVESWTSNVRDFTQVFPINILLGQSPVLATSKHSSAHMQEVLKRKHT